MQQLKQNQELIKELMEQRIGIQNDYPVLPDEELKRNRIRKKRKDEVFVLVHISPVGETRYYVSNYTRAISQTAVNRKINILQQHLSDPEQPDKSYLYVKFVNKKMYLNRLVADAFVPNEYNDGTLEDKEAHHINRDRKDNRPENLVWLSQTDHDILHKKIDRISLYEDGQCAIEWHRLSAEELDLEDLVLMIEYTEVPLPLFYSKLQEQGTYTFDYTGKYSGDRRSMRVKVIGKGADMPEISVSGKGVNYTVVVRLKEEFVLDIGKTPLTEEQKEAHREDKRSGEFDRRIQESLELQKQTELLFDMVK